MPTKRPAGFAKTRTPLPIWQRPVFWTAAGAGLLAVLVLLFFLFRPEQPANSRGEIANSPSRDRSVVSQTQIPVAKAPFRREPAPPRSTPDRVINRPAIEFRTAVPLNTPPNSVHEGARRSDQVGEPLVLADAPPPKQQRDAIPVKGGGVAPSVLTDEVIAAILKAKEQHAKTLQTLASGLTDRMNAKLKEVAASGNLQAAKAAMTEIEAWTKDNTLPTSANLSTDVKHYLEQRRAASTQLARAYKSAIAGYTKELKIEQATSVEQEMDTFVKKEKALLSGQQSKEAALKVDTEDQEVIRQKNPKMEEVEKEFMAGFIDRLRESLEKVASEDTTLKQDKAYRSLMDRLDAELQKKKLTFHFPIKNIEGRGEEFMIYLDEPEELRGTRVTRLSSMAIKVSEQDAAKISAGDIFIASGNGRIASGYFNSVRSDNTLCILSVNNPRGTDQSIYLQKFSERIVMKGADGKEVVLDLKSTPKKGEHPVKKNRAVRQ
ncbi:MAG: hypothetical protein K8T25_15485 [Planctomycetia bacterium]|nr:hypothetical protein [Planctomycetia bacterium]